MAVLSAVFADKAFDAAAALAFGFVECENKGEYLYSVPIVGGQFVMNIAVSEPNDVSADIIDAETGDEYVLHITAGDTGFAGRVRKEFDRVLAEAADMCFVRNVFKSDFAQRVIGYVRERYGDKPEYLWQRFPNNAVFRRGDNAKWYGILLVLPMRKLGFDSDAAVDILDVRVDPQRIGDMVNGERYFAGYHMNKRHWITVRLDGSVPLDEIFAIIDDSYLLAAKR